MRTVLVKGFRSNLESLESGFTPAINNSSEAGADNWRCVERTASDVYSAERPLDKAPFTFGVEKYCSSDKAEVRVTSWGVNGTPRS